ncbi:MAG TPA: divergent polysaccharide deacetylase family protein [Micavibrio sp.]|nr:divergent polysaccharide deacetylase family protein [Micavibrio sp.]
MKKGRSVEPGTAKFVAIAVVLMIICDQFVFGGSRPYIDSAREDYARKIAAQKELQEDPPPVPPAIVRPEDGYEYFEAPLPLPEDMHEEKAAPPTPLPPVEKEKPKIDKKAFIPHGAPKVAIIIDDLGMDLKRSRAVMDLPAPVTLAFLPYGTKTKEYAEIGKKKGHSLIIHTPMEAMDGTINIGPGGLKEAMTGEEFDKAFDVMLKSFDGYEGINNHMGSRLTADGGKMERLMKTLKSKGLFFVDSKTNPKSVAAGEAQMGGVPFAERDVFIDHVETLEFARKALKHTEELALRRGYAIAIGHPKDNTIAALKEWLPTLKAKGIELVPVKELLIQPKDLVPVVIPPPAVESIAAGAEIRGQGEEMDPRLRGDAVERSGDVVAGTPPAVIPDPDPAAGAPAPPPEMFPEVTPSSEGADGSGIRLDPLPEQLPGPSSQIH